MASEGEAEARVGAFVIGDDLEEALVEKIEEFFGLCRGSRLAIGMCCERIW